MAHIRIRLTSWLISCLLLVSVQGQNLITEFQNQVVSMEVMQTGLYVDGNFGGGITAIARAQHPVYLNQQFQLEPTAQANWYRIRDTRTSNYLTVSTPVENASLNWRASGHGNNPELQEFRFVAQTEPGRYKIHSRFDVGLLALVVEIDPAATSLTGLRLGQNITVGNSDHQRFDLDRLYPDVDPSSAVPTLADRFQGRTVGFTVRSNGGVWRGNATRNRVVESVVFSNFEAEFSIDGTNETGWYKIRHRATNRLVTLQLAAKGVDVALQDPIAGDDNRQRFKFVITSNDSTYKIHTKYQYGVGVNRVALVLEMPPAGSTTDSLRCVPNNNSLAPQADWNQQFILSRFFPPRAEFDGGVATDGSAKLFSKQYYITVKETLSLLEPTIQGTDTFVRWQPVVRYGEASEWTFEAGRKQNGIQYFKVRFGPTNQYLCIPAANPNQTPAGGLRAQLKTKLDDSEDNRFEFRITEDGSINNWFSLFSLVAPNLSNLTRLSMSGEGILEVDDGVAASFDGRRKFAINLSIPLDSTKLYNIVTKNQGQFVSDSGWRVNGATVYRLKYSDYSCFWHFIPQPGGRFLIQNTLTKQYLTNNGSNALNATITMTNNRNAVGTLWELSRVGNYYNIRSAASGRFLALMNQPDDGRPVFQGLSTDAGSDWMVYRGDYRTDPTVPSIVSRGLLELYQPEPINALTDNLYRDQLIRNIGLPYEPALRATLYGNVVSQADSVRTGIATTADFLSVVRSALQFQFGFSAARADSAIRNYKLDSIGMRTEMVYALKQYVLNNLALRSRSTWNFHEQELVGYLERTIKAMRYNYGNQIDSAWTTYQQLSGEINTLTFSALIQGPVDTDAFNFPAYFVPDDGQAQMLIEYAGASTDRDFKNPGFLGTVFTVPAVSGASVMTILIAASKTVRVANAISIVAEKSFSSAFASAFGGVLSTMTGPFLILITAVQVLAMQAMEVSEFIQFDQDVQRNVTRLKTSEIDISVMNTPQEMKKLDLTKDIDYILGTGERFVSSTGRRYTFNGSGNWSNRNNWLNGNVPPAVLQTGEVIISPAAGRECIIDLPVTIPTGVRVKVRPNSNVKVMAPLSVPSFILRQ